MASNTLDGPERGRNRLPQADCSEPPNYSAKHDYQRSRTCFTIAVKALNSDFGTDLMDFDGLIIDILAGERFVARDLLDSRRHPGVVISVVVALVTGNRFI